MCREIGFQFRRTRISHCVRRVSPQSFLTVFVVDAVAVGAIANLSNDGRPAIGRTYSRKKNIFVRSRLVASFPNAFFERIANPANCADSSPNVTVVRPAKKHAIGNPRKRIRARVVDREVDVDRKIGTRRDHSPRRLVRWKEETACKRIAVDSARSRESYSFERAFRRMNFSESRDATRRSENLLRGRVSRRGKTTTDRTIIRKLFSMFVENEFLSLGEKRLLDPCTALLVTGESVRQSATS